jgi:uncharacterized protein YecE (DUF72 family)
VSDCPLFAGTSGFAYASWKPAFYPEKLPSSQFLQYYGSRLNAVEVNYTYRRIAAASTFDKWLQATPAGFVFLPKAHMKITHSLKLKDAEDFTRYFLQSLEPLRAAGRLGPILFQLPPSLAADSELLSEFARLLPTTSRAAFEFRNASWFTDETYKILSKHQIALCLAENENLETPPVVTADFVYLRLRKPDYSESELLAIDRRIQQYLSNSYPTYAIFKHEDTPAGAMNAEKLLQLHQRGGSLLSLAKAHE